MPRLRQAVLTLPAYHPPLAGREGLRFDFNENTVGCSLRVLEFLRTVDAQQIACYPERTPVEAVVARHLRVAPEELLLTNGIDEAIHLMCETYLESGDEVLVPVPSFAMYEVFSAATGANVLKVPAGEDFAFPMKDLRNRVSARTRMIAIASPNNPTGAAARPEVLRELAAAAPNAALLIDEAYFEFYGQSLIGAWRDLPNVFVARTFSKAYGMAGLRLGILMGHSDTMATVRRVASPYNVNSIALACLPPALEDEGYVREYAAETRSSRERLQQQLRAWGIKFWPSQANFVLIKIGRQHGDFVQAMRAKGILVRDRSSDPLCDGCVRITVGTAQQTDRLITALAEALAEFGMLTQELLR